MKMRHFLGFLVIIALVAAISGCTKNTQPAQVAPTPSAPAPSAQTTAPSAQTTAPGEQLNNAKETGSSICGDGICQNVEHLYPDAGVVCSINDCTISGQYTENNYNCPKDCGTKCSINAVIGFNPANVCALQPNGDIQLTIKNSGKGKIDGFLFYISQSPVGAEGKIDITTSEKGIDVGESGVYTLDISKWKQEFGSVDHVQIMPRIIENGQTKECSNQKNLIPLRVCK
jgi:hypothetical protein